MRDILIDDTSGRRASGFKARSDTYLHMEYAQAAMQSLTWTGVHLAQSDVTFGRPGAHLENRKRKHSMFAKKDRCAKKRRLQEFRETLDQA